MVTPGQKMSQAVTEVLYGQTWSKDVTGRQRGLIWSYLVKECHRWSQRFNLVTPGHRMSEAVTEFILVKRGQMSSQKSEMFTTSQRRSQGVREILWSDLV